jgi:hypothetical protein
MGQERLEIQNLNAVNKLKFKQLFFVGTKQQQLFKLFQLEQLEHSILSIVIQQQHK